MITDKVRLVSAYKAIMLVFMAVIVHYSSCLADSTESSLPNGFNRPGFISIDCGSTNDYNDTGLMIYYKADSEFVDTGESKEVSPRNMRSAYWNHLKTLRSFPNGTKNCYTLRPEQGKNNKYLIRATFWYGNYDGANKVPEFDVYIGVNLWSTVGEDWVTLEIIHTPSNDTIFVCLVNTGAGIPYISSLELRLLDNSIYPITVPQTGLLMSERFDLGKHPQDFAERYVDDAYDRLWWRLLYFNTDSWNSNTTAISAVKDGNNSQYRLPVNVLRDGITAKAKNYSIELTLDLDPQFYYYVYFHFLELQQPNTGSRHFNIYLNDANYGVVSLDNDSWPKTVIPSLKPIQGGIAFSLNATADSDLPAILNAYEVYRVLPLPAAETHEGDVKAIMGIKKTYEIAKDDWQGDPCFPKFIWSGLDCKISEPNPPRIISLNLSYQNLTSSIAPSIANLTALQTLDLSYSSLNGTLPKFLWNLPSLKSINLEGNNLSGSIPQFILDKQKNGTLDLRFCGNPNLELSMPCEPKMNSEKNKKHMLVITISAASTIPILVVLLTIMIHLWRRRRTINEAVEDLAFKKKTREFKSSELASITDNLKNVIGEGGFGKVYHGILKDGSEVAIKLLSASSRQGIREFRAEAEILTKIHHRNLVSLVGYCHDGNNMALIYEFMSNGNLQQHISESNRNVLSWKDRLKIAVDSSRGIEYLHSGCNPPIVHRDLKSSNILLNEEFQAKIADFGLSKMFANENDTNLMTALAGTLGYLDPEYHARGKLSRKSDVYSFGVVLLELITGKSRVIKDPENMHISEWVMSLVERGDREGIMDARLEGNYNTNSAWKVVEIAMACVSQHAVQRPDIGHVHFELKECLKMEVASPSCMETNTSNNTMRNTPEMNQFSGDIQMSFSGPR